MFPQVQPGDWAQWASNVVGEVMFLDGLERLQSGDKGLTHFSFSSFLVVSFP